MRFADDPFFCREVVAVCRAVIPRSGCRMMRRFGAVFAVAIASSVFSAYGHLGSASAVTDGLRPAIGVSALLSLIGATTALMLKRHAQPRPEIERAAAANMAA
jgi:hypothetical protein